MANWTTWRPQDTERLRTEMFEVHPEVFGTPAPLPRRTDGREYTPPADATESGPAADGEAR